MNKYMNPSVKNYFKERSMGYQPSHSQQYNITNSGIDDVLYQKVVSRLECSPQQGGETIVPLMGDGADNYFQDTLETYDINSLYDPSNRWMFWLTLALVAILVYLLYKYQSPTLSAETIRATILGYSP